jgi:hypothetical protein
MCRSGALESWALKLYLRLPVYLEQTAKPDMSGRASRYSCCHVSTPQRRYA